MILFDDICKKIYDYFCESGSPGIDGIGDAGEVWIFIKAPRVKNRVDYGSRPIFVDKKTGNMRYMDWYNDYDWQLHDNANKVDVPTKYRATN